MDSLSGLGRAVATALAQKRIGAPVSLRAHFRLSADHGRLLPLLEAALAAAGSWFASAPSRAYALGDIRTGEITALVNYAGGQTALVSVGVLRDPLPLADLLLIGNHGTLRFQEPLPPGDVLPTHAQLRRALERSLASQAPVEVEP